MKRSRVNKARAKRQPSVEENRSVQATDEEDKPRVTIDIEQAREEFRRLAEVKDELQELKAEVAEIKTSLKELRSYLREIFPSPAPQPHPEAEVVHPSAEQSPPETPADAAGGEVMGAETAVDISTVLSAVAGMATRIMNWQKRQYSRRDEKQAKAWEEEWTLVVEQEEGDLFIVMKGIPGITLPQDHCDELVKPILAREREDPSEEARQEAEFMRHALVCRDRRWLAFERQVGERKNRFRHIMPIGALEQYRRTGFHRPDEWTLIYRGDPAPRQQRAADIRYIIELLDKYDPYYQLGLLVGPAGETDLFKHFFWEIKGGHTVILEDRRDGEACSIIRDPGFVSDLCRFSDSLWKNNEVIKDKQRVQEMLEAHARSLEKAPATS